MLLSGLFLALVFAVGANSNSEFSTEAYDVYTRAMNIGDAAEDEEFYYGMFPDDFIWSSATSAYQIEGAWDADGKGESIWDRYAQQGMAENGDTGNVACNSYYQYEDDIANLVSLGVSQYRFSIAWTRIQPTGEDATPNPAGLAYYNTLIDRLLEVGIEPVATLYHWDLPQALSEKGGWLEGDFIIDAFTNYARICFDNFGDRVKIWITINEPWIVALLGYGYGNFPPNINGIGEEVYVCGYNLIRAHAEAYHLYDDEYRPTQGGQIAITLNTNWQEAKNRSVASDIDAAMRELEFTFGWFANPIYVNGDYPDIMKLRIAEKSAQQGLTSSRLPAFTEEQKQRNLGTSDFFGLNYYTSSLVTNVDSPVEPPSYDNDRATLATADPDWPTSGSSWLFKTPFGMRKILNYIKNKYGEPRIQIIENGISDRNDSIADSHRVGYYRDYLNNVLKAIDLDGVNVFGYTAWSLMDNFEWDTGYSENFGLYQVDFNDPQRPRTPKDSAAYFTQIVSANGFPPPPANE